MFRYALTASAIVSCLTFGIPTVALAQSDAKQDATKAGDEVKEAGAPFSQPARGTD